MKNLWGLGCWKVIIVIVFVAIFGAILALGTLSSSSNGDEDFWNWFSANQAAIATITTGHEPVADQLSARLSEIDSHLTWEFGGSATSTPREFIISADGIQSSFPSVIRLTNAAPKNLKNWKIIAFRQITDTEKIAYEGGTLSIDALSFSSQKNGDKYDIYVYVKNYQEVDKTIVFLFLDSWLGEYNTETKLGGIDIVPYDTKNASTHLPFRDIAKYIL